MQALDVSKWLSNKFYAAWYVYLLLLVVASLVTISFYGYVAAEPRSPFCLSFYSVLLVGLFVAQVGFLAFMLFNHIWAVDKLNDISSSFNSTYHFFWKNWKIIRWVALRTFILVIALVLALYLIYVYRVQDDITDTKSLVHPLILSPNDEERRNPGGTTESTSRKE